MANIWEQNGKIIEKDGKPVECDSCPCEDDSPCSPGVIAKHVTNAENPTWDLRPYKNSGSGGMIWRLIEVGYRLVHAQGEISPRGTLEGLNSTFVSDYEYDGYMELQKGCRDADGREYWPGG